MTEVRRYLYFSIAQYVHDRREERLNVGVVVHDPERQELRAQFEPAPATRRIKAAFPDVDRKGLELYLADLGVSLVRDKRLAEAAAGGQPLAFLADSWRNVLRFTPPRAYPARDVKDACERLLGRYVTPPVFAANRDELRGIERAKVRTREALHSVLNLVQDVGYRPFYHERPVFRNGRAYKVPLEFPFFVADRFAIDALSFEGEGVKESLREASLFIDKVKDLRGVGVDLVPGASVAVDPDRPELGHALIADILEKTGLPDDSVVEANDAETLAHFIEARLALAA